MSLSSEGESTERQDAVNSQSKFRSLLPISVIKIQETRLRCGVILKTEKDEAYKSNN